MKTTPQYKVGDKIVLEIRDIQISRNDEGQIKGEHGIIYSLVGREYPISEAMLYWIDKSFKNYSETEEYLPYLKN
jgi:hypothetical protein